MLARAIAWAILRHQIEIGAGRNLLGQELQRRLRAGDVVGQHEMAHEKAALGEPLGVDDEVACLPMHLGQRRPIDPDVVAHMRIFVRRLVVAIFEVGHVDVDDAVEQGERLQAVVAAGVVDEREAQPARGGDAQGRDDLRHDVARRDEIDVVAADRLQSQHQAGELLVARLRAFASPGNLEILAIDAAQVAPGEEDRARAPRAAQRILFPEMRPGRMDDRPLACLADCAPRRAEPVDPTVAGAEIAILEMRTGRTRALGELA